MAKKELNKQRKKLDFSGWLEIFVFIFSAIHLTFLLLSLFNVFRPDVMSRLTFSYITAFVLLAVCLLLFLALMLAEKLGKFSIPNWLKCVMYVGFFVFTNTYYTFGLFENFWTLLVFYAFLGFILNIISLSLFYNLQKSENGIIKTNNSFIVLFTLTASIAAATIVEIIATGIKILAKTNSISIVSFLANLGTIVIVSIIMSVIFYISLIKTKRLINHCLIKSIN